jgi:YHS domain-containing protein
MAKKGCANGKCPNCETEINENTAKYVTDHEGQKYYFCSGSCMKEFSVGKGKFIGP